MQKLPSVKDLPLENKTVLLRVDYDVPLKEEGQEWIVADDSRITESLPTINYLLEQKAKVILLSHLGRPEGKTDPKLSLKPVAKCLGQFLKREVLLITDLTKIEGQDLVMLENLRFWPEEENNNLAFAKKLASLGDFYINDAFACMHRAHTSIVGLPHFLTSAFGFDSLEEIEVLSGLKNNPSRLVTLILGGAKVDKLEVIEELLNWADNILIGGKLPQLIKQSYPDKVTIADLNAEGKDITLETINKFKEIIAKSGTIIWAGPMGVFEEEAFQKGTEEIARALSQSQAYKVIGGGDTEAALTKFNLIEKIDFVSSGGGAMFEFLAQGTLPGIEAIINNEKFQTNL
ncbi:MAG: phosphoglycerate kinase [Candidatus Shapirobacteria bacterium]|nr:phosphoglycerate kinase [Candidatus Shapirobacteria bacterium]